MAEDKKRDGKDYQGIMKKAFLVSSLNRLADKSNGDLGDDPCAEELIHIQADDLILEYINDPQISEAFNLIVKGYA